MKMIDDVCILSDSTIVQFDNNGDTYFYGGKNWKRKNQKGIKLKFSSKREAINVI